MKLRRLSSVLTAAFATALAYPPQAAAQIVEWTESRGCVGSVEYNGQTFGNVATIRGVECMVANVLATATTFIGLAAFVMLIIGSFLYLTSGSSTKGTEAGKQTLTYAVIGIVVALMAFFVLQLIATITGVGGFLQFNLNIGN